MPCLRRMPAFFSSFYFLITSQRPSATTSGLQTRRLFNATGLLTSFARGPDTCYYKFLAHAMTVKASSMPILKLPVMINTVGSVWFCNSSNSRQFSALVLFRSSAISTPTRRNRPMSMTISARHWFGQCSRFDGIRAASTQPFLLASMTLTPFLVVPPSRPRVFLWGACWRGAQLFLPHWSVFSLQDVAFGCFGFDLGSTGRFRSCWRLEIPEGALPMTT